MFVEIYLIHHIVIVLVIRAASASCVILYCLEREREREREGPKLYSSGIFIKSRGYSSRTSICSLVFDIAKSFHYFIDEIATKSCIVFAESKQTVAMARR